jgi:hypothetical protein
VVRLIRPRKGRDGYRPPKWQQDLTANYDKLRVSDSDPVYEYDCLGCGGGCCMNNDVLVGPHDVWRIVTSDIGKAMGFTTSHHLFTPQPGRDRAMFDYYLGPESRLPMACIRYRQPAKDFKVCPFLAKAYVVTSPEDMKKAAAGDPEGLPLMKNRDGAAAGLCALEEAKPTICRAYPLGRMGLANREKGKPGDKAPEMFYVWAEGKRCREFRRPESKLTVGEYVKKWGLDEAYRQSDLVNDWREQTLRIPNERARHFLGMVFHDFDLPTLARLEEQGVPEEQRYLMTMAARPKTFDELADIQTNTLKRILGGRLDGLSGP